jgi:hypothetical protein
MVPAEDSRVGCMARYLSCATDPFPAAPLRTGYVELDIIRFMLSTGLCRTSRENSSFALVSRVDEGDWVGIIRAV